MKVPNQVLAILTAMVATTLGGCSSQQGAATHGGESEQAVANAVSESHDVAEASRDYRGEDHGAEGEEAGPELAAHEIYDYTRGGVRLVSGVRFQHYLLPRDDH